MGQFKTFVTTPSFMQNSNHQVTILTVHVFHKQKHRCQTAKKSKKVVLLLC